MLHETYADAVRKQVAEQALDERREAGHPLAADGDAELEPHEAPERPPVHDASGRAPLHGGDHPVDDQLADPQDGQRDERPDDPERQDRHGVPAVRLVDELEQGRDVLEGLAVVRATLSQRQLYEVMVDFWTNHFNVYFAKGADRFLTPDYIEHTIRPRAMGKFQ